MLRVGLTGGIASGKSHVARRLAKAGFYSLDLDQVAHAVMAPGGAAHADVAEAFGAVVVAADGSIDRKALGRIVFADPAARVRLNRLVHPRVRDEEARIAAGLPDRQGAVLVVEAALLVESGIHLRFDRLVVTYCPPEEQARRLRARDGLDAGAAEARLRAQMPPSEKRRFAHETIDTSGTLEQTDARTDEIAMALRAVAAAPGVATAVAPRMMARLLPPPAHTWRYREQGDPGLDLGRLQQMLNPGARAPWYEPGEPLRVPSETMAAVGAVEALRRRGDDRDYAAGVAYALARLTEADPEAIASVTLVGLALHEAACGEAAGPSPAALELSRRWAGIEPSPRGRAAARAAAVQLRATD